MIIDGLVFLHISSNTCQKKGYEKYLIKEK